MSKFLGKQHYTASFELEFPYAGDTCYLAYHYPYTYTRLRADLRQINGTELNFSNKIEQNF